MCNCFMSSTLILLFVFFRLPSGNCSLVFPRVRVRGKTRVQKKTRQRQKKTQVTTAHTAITRPQPILNDNGAKTTTARQGSRILILWWSFLGIGNSCWPGTATECGGKSAGGSVFCQPQAERLPFDEGHSKWPTAGSHNDDTQQRQQSGSHNRWVRFSYFLG